MSSPETPTPALLLVPEVAAVLRTSAKSVYSMIERGAIPGVIRIGRRVLIRRDSLVDWLSQKSTPSLEKVGRDEREG